VFIQYWSMRVMAYSAVVVTLLAAWGLWLVWRKRMDTATWFLRVAVWAVVLPFLMNTAGWLLTESGRQPWIVQGVLLTRDGVSPSVSAATVGISLTVFVLLYAALAVVAVVLMIRYARRELPDARPSGDEDVSEPAFSY
jgi:cytochrome d ubiquinol oxidase subunit I